MATRINPCYPGGSSSDEAAQVAAQRANEAAGAAEGAVANVQQALAEATAAKQAAEEMSTKIDELEALMDNLLNSALKSSTASGSTITITDGADGIPIKSLIVELNNIALIDSFTINHTVGGVTTPYTIQFIDEQGGTILVQRPATLDVTNGTITTQSGTVKLQGGGLEIKTALGENTFSVQSADMTMVYRADTGLFLDQHAGGKTYLHNTKVNLTNGAATVGEIYFTYTSEKSAPYTLADIGVTDGAPKYGVIYPATGYFVNTATSKYQPVYAFRFDTMPSATVYFITADGTATTVNTQVETLTDVIG